MHKSPLASEATAPKILVAAIILFTTFLVTLFSASTFLTTSNTSAISSSTQVDIAVTLAPVIAITTNVDSSSNTLSIPIAPDSDGNLGTGNLLVNVSTNNQTGYKLTMNSKTSNTSLVHTTTPTNTITSTTAPLATPATLTPNHWGYWRWEDSRVTTPTTFARIPNITPDTLRTTTTPATTSNTTLTFAANINLMQPQGHYQNTMVFTAVGNAVPQPPQCPVLTGKTYLQDITTPTGPLYGQPNQRTILKDRRNNQDYYVQNILNQDGSCTAWMETNLRYAGDGDNTYGDAKTLTLHSGTGYIGGSQANAYTTAGYIDLYARGQGTDTLDTTNPTNNTLFYGYLYNWCAAMGGQANACNDTETSQVNLDTTQSICPSGWRLPTGGSATTTDYKNLNNTINSGSTTSPQGLIDNFLAVYSGYYSNGLYGQGANGLYWSSTVYNAAGAYGLYFNATAVNPGTVNNTKSGGRAVRCIL